MKLLVNDINIDWTNSQSHYFFNIKHPKALEFEKTARQVPVLESHIYLYTSSYSKICLLSKKAILFSAGLANQNLKANDKDKWLISLPFFHVSGISILARAFLTGSPRFIQKGAWNPCVFKETIQKKGVTLSSLVPTQVYDLIQQNLSAPKSLRAVLVGGDYLSSSIYKKARELGWPLMICYGATETCSHIASSSLASLREKSRPKMKLLSCIQAYPVQKTSCGYAFLKIKSQGLASAYFDLKQRKLYDPKEEGNSFILKDFLLLKGKRLEVLSFVPDRVKILGERVDLKKLQAFLAKLSQEQNIKSCLMHVPDERRGCRLVLLGSVDHFEKLSYLVRQFNHRVSGYEKIQSLYLLSQFSPDHFVKLKPELFLEILKFF